MKTFAEWVQENHPEDEILNEFLGDFAARLANSKAGRAVRTGVAAASLGLGAFANPEDAKAITPPMPQHQTQDEDVSSRPFDRKYLISLAVDEKVRAMQKPDMIRYFPNPENLEKMTDLELWKWQNDFVKKMIKDANKNGYHLSKVEGPLPWLRIGNHYGWKRPAMPEEQLRTMPSNMSSLGGGR